MLQVHKMLQIQALDLKIRCYQSRLNFTFSICSISLAIHTAQMLSAQQWKRAYEIPNPLTPASTNVIGKNFNHNESLQF